MDNSSPTGRKIARATEGNSPIEIVKMEGQG